MSNSLIPFQQWLHDNPDKTLEDACAAYKEISSIQFIREQFDKDPEMAFEKAVSNWNKLKAK